MRLAVGRCRKPALRQKHVDVLRRTKSSPAGLSRARSSSIEITVSLQNIKCVPLVCQCLSGGMVADSSSSLSWESHPHAPCSRARQATNTTQEQAQISDSFGFPPFCVPLPPHQSVKIVLYYDTNKADSGQIWTLARIWRESACRVPSALACSPTSMSGLSSGTGPETDSGGGYVRLALLHVVLSA